MDEISYKRKEATKFGKEVMRNNIDDTIGFGSFFLATRRCFCCFFFDQEFRERKFDSNIRQVSVRSGLIYFFFFFVFLCVF